MTGRATSAAQVFVGNVDVNTSEHELAVFLDDVLAPVRVVAVGIPKAPGGRGHGVAFLDLEATVDVDVVCARLEGTVFRGRPLRARRAMDGTIRGRPGWCAAPEAHVFVGNVPHDATDAALAAHVATIADVAHVALPRDPTTGRGRGIAFVALVHPEDADRVIGLLHGVEFMGRPLRTGPAAPRVRPR